MGGARRARPPPRSANGSATANSLIFYRIEFDEI